MRILQLEDFTREDMKVEVENELATFIGLLDVDRSQWPSKEFEKDIHPIPIKDKDYCLWGPK
jgi:hypothetical protein